MGKAFEALAIPEFRDFGIKGLSGIQY